MGRIEDNLTEKFNKDLYVVVKGCVDPDYIKWAHEYYIHKFDILKDYELKRTGVVKDGKMIYGDSLAEVLLFSMTSIMEEVVGKNLCPTYSFTRKYEEGHDLMKHKDRPSCEYSMTLPLNYTGWPIIAEGKEVYLSPGDALVYKGQEVEHWRDALPKGYQLQHHLHYVDVDGPCKAWKYDKRQRYIQHPFLQ